MQPLIRDDAIIAVMPIYIDDIIIFDDTVFLLSIWADTLPFIRPALFGNLFITIRRWSIDDSNRYWKFLVHYHSLLSIRIWYSFVSIPFCPYCLVILHYDVISDTIVISPITLFTVPEMQWLPYGIPYITVWLLFYRYCNRCYSVVFIRYLFRICGRRGVKR